MLTTVNNFLRTSFGLNGILYLISFYVSFLMVGFVNTYIIKSFLEGQSAHEIFSAVYDLYFFSLLIGTPALIRIIKSLKR